MKTGATSWNLDTLSEEAAQRIHQASLSLREDPGIFGESDLFLDIFQCGGASVDRDSRVIRLSPDMVEAAIESAPRSFVLHGRHDPDMDLLIEPGHVVYGIGGTSEPPIWDYNLMKSRRPGSHRRELSRTNNASSANQDCAPFPHFARGKGQTRGAS